MHTDRETARIVRSWLEEGRTALPDHIRAAVLDQAPATPRRRSWWPAWRLADMNSFAKFAIAAAAVVVIAVVGINLMPRPDGGGVGGPSVTASPSLTQQPSPVPSAIPAAFPPAGPLAVGTYPALVEGAPLSFKLRASGWISETGDLGFFDSIVRKPEGVFEQPDSAGIRFWRNSPDNVYADPCAHTQLRPAPSASVASLAAAVAKMPGIDIVAQARDVTIDGHPGRYVAFTIRDDIGCAPHDFYLWYDQSSGGANGGWVWASALGSLHRVWILDVDGKPAFIESETFKGAKPEMDQEIQAIVDSIQFE
jgi:hypothetical protein